MPTLEGKLVEQNGVVFAEFSNKKFHSHHAVISNQEDVKSLTVGSFCNFEVIALTRPSKGFSNLHVIRHRDVFNLLGTNGQVDSFKDLIDVDYLPLLVTFNI